MQNNRSLWMDWISAYKIEMAKYMELLKMDEKQYAEKRFELMSRTNPLYVLKNSVA
jgi:hypothetical protein